MDPKKCPKCASTELTFSNKENRTHVARCKSCGKLVNFGKGEIEKKTDKKEGHPSPAPARGRADSGPAKKRAGKRRPVRSGQRVPEKKPAPEPQRKSIARRFADFLNSDL